MTKPKCFSKNWTQSDKKSRRITRTRWRGFRTNVTFGSRSLIRNGKHLRKWNNSSIERTQSLKRNSACSKNSTLALISKKESKKQVTKRGLRKQKLRSRALIQMLEKHSTTGTLRLSLYCNWKRSCKNWSDSSQTCSLHMRKTRLFGKANANSWRIKKKTIKRTLMNLPESLKSHLSSYKSETETNTDNMKITIIQ